MTPAKASDYGSKKDNKQNQLRDRYTPQDAGDGVTAPRRTRASLTRDQEHTDKIVALWDLYRSQGCTVAYEKSRAWFGENNPLTQQYKHDKFRYVREIPSFSTQS